jgi:pyruvate/2-oxoglutarate dehydrogenase complex dihydrolipoamide dehydrogenase (E3) component
MDHHEKDQIIALENLNFIENTNDRRLFLTKKVDVAIIGAGSGGLTAAYTARGFGKSVLLIDKKKPGGECTWSGCIPSKTFINLANDIHTARRFSDIKVNTAAMMQEIRKVIENVYADESIEVLNNDGIDFLMGTARFKNIRSIEVNGEEIDAKRIFICTGSSPVIPSIEGISNVEVLTDENFFLQEDLPESMIIMGAGAVGIEIAQALNRIGVTVDVVEMADSILPKEDMELTLILQRMLEKEGVRIHKSAKAVKLSGDDNKVIALLEGVNGKSTITANKILMAVGRLPNVDGLDLDNAGIKYTKKGIEVDGYLETSVKGVYATGDVVGPYMFSHMANAQSIRAVQNAILPFRKKINYQNVAWCTFTSPELANAGMSETEARNSHGDDIRVYRHSYDHIDRAKTKPGSSGIVKLILDKRGMVLGCTILGDNAGEIISDIQIVKTLGLKFSMLSRVIYPYPTYGEVLNKISKKVLAEKIGDLKLVKLYRKYFNGN